MSEWSGLGAAGLRQAILSPTTLVPMIRRSPEKAAELVLTALLVEPRVDDGLMMPGAEFGITDDLRSSDALPEGGPLLALFNHAPTVAVHTLLQIVEHATDAWRKSSWADFEDHSIGAAFEIVVDGKSVQLAGNANVVRWYRGDPRVPSQLSAALMALERYLYSELDAGSPVDDLLELLVSSKLLAIYGVLAEVASYKPELLDGQLACLGTSAALILEGRLASVQSSSFYLLGARSQTDWNRRKQWHEMPHRGVPIERFLLPRIIQGGRVADLVKDARRVWAADPNDRWRFVVAQMDPANYQASDLGDGITGWVFTPPQTLLAEIEADSKRLDSDHWWTSAPWRFSKLVDDGDYLENEEAHALFEELRERIETPPPDELIDAGVLRVEDVKCGAAAVLLVRASAWVSATPDAQAFCRAALFEPFANPPRTHSFDSNSSPVDGSWDGFAATAIPLLWASDISDRETREVAVRLATHPHYATVQRFFEAARRQHELRHEVQRLEVLALHWARFAAWRSEYRFRQENASYWGDASSSVADLPDVAGPTQTLIQSFVEETLGVDIPDFADFIASTPEGMLLTRTKVSTRLQRSVSLSYLAAAWSHMWTDLDGMRTADLGRVVAVATRLAETLAASWVPDDRGHIGGTPTVSERSFLRGLAKVCVRVSPMESRSIWQPILTAGAPAHYWVEDFLNAVWIAGLEEHPSPASFASLIKEMMVFSENQAAWGGFHASGLRLSLLCLHRYGYPRMTSEHGDLLAELGIEWRDRARALVLTGGHDATPVVRFLATDIGLSIAAEGVSWLVDTINARTSLDDDLAQATADLLVTLSVREPEMLRTGPAAEVLAHLVAMQNPVALQVSAQIVRHA